MATAIYTAGMFIATALNPNIEVKAKLFVPTCVFAVLFDLALLAALFLK